jgi:uncharacterized protein YkwD
MRPFRLRTYTEYSSRAYGWDGTPAAIAKRVLVCYSPAIVPFLSALRSLKRFPVAAIAALAFLLPAPQAHAVNANEQAIFDKLRTDSDQGRPFMVLDPLLCQVARAKAADLADRDYYDHTDPDGHGPNWWVEHAGYPLPDYYDHSPDGNNIESIAGGYPDPDGAWDVWMDSGGHRQHLLATVDFYAQQTSVGVGFVSRPGSRYTNYWVVLTAPPAGPNPYLDAAGRYGGMFSAGENQAILRVMLNATGVFTGRLRLPGASLAVNGTFGENGRATLNLGSGYTLALSFDEGMAGTLTGPGFSSEFALETIAKTAGARGGRYTLVLASSDPASGFGSAVVRVLADGTAALAGNLPNGAAFTASSPLTESGALLLYLGQNAGAGQVAGPLYFRTSSTSDLDGTLHWLNPAAAVNSNLDAVGARYAAPTAGQTALPVTSGANNATLTLDASSFAAPVVQTATLTTDPVLAIGTPQLPSLVARVNAAAGRFSGRYNDPVTGALVRYRGVILQKQSAAFGTLLGASGPATLAPAGAPAQLSRP